MEKQNHRGNFFRRKRSFAQKVSIEKTFWLKKCLPTMQKKIQQTFKNIFVQKLK